MATKTEMTFTPFGDYGCEAAIPGDGYAYLKIPATKDKARPSHSGKMVLTASTASFQSVPGSEGLRVNLSAGFSAK